MTTEEFYQLIVEAKQEFSSLDGLTPVDDRVQRILNDFNDESQVQPWRVWAWLFAKAAGVNYQQFLLHVEEIKGLIDAANGINTPWLIKKAKEWEFGNTSLSVPESGDPFYAVSDPSLRLVTVASVQRIRGITLLLVAKGQAGSYQALTPSELDSLRTYIDRIQPPGAAIAVDSRNPDSVAIGLRFYYKGFAQAALVEPQLIQAIKDFLSALDFAGFLDLQAFNGAVKAVPEWVSHEIDTIRIRRAGTGNSYIDFTGARGYSTYAGWAVLDEAESTFTLVAV